MTNNNLNFFVDGRSKIKMDMLWIVLAIVLVAIVALAFVTFRKARREEAAALAGLEPTEEGQTGAQRTEVYPCDDAR
jgi:uncharacterized protein (UPF0333 family)